MHVTGIILIFFISFPRKAIAQLRRIWQAIEFPPEDV